MKLGSRVNAIRSHGTFLKRHPERRARLRVLVCSNDAPPPAGKTWGLLDAVLKSSKRRGSGARARLGGH